MKILALDPTLSSLSSLENACRNVLGTELTEFASAGSTAAALRRLAAHPFDLILLDGGLPAGAEPHLLALRPDLAARTVVLSPDPTHAVTAFEHGALDFVPQPVQLERLAKALQRGNRSNSGGNASPRVIAVRRFGRINLVPVDDLLYVEAADKYSELVLTNGERSFHDQCLGRLETTLPRSFVRIHKSYLVRFPMVSRLLVRKGSRYFAVLRNGQQLPVGRSRYAELKSRMI